MAYVVPGNSGYENIPWNTCESSSDLVNGSCIVLETVYESSATTLWAGPGGMQIRSMSPNRTILRTPYGGTEQGFTLNGEYVGIVAYSIPAGDDQQNRIIWLSSGSGDPAYYLQEVADSHWAEANILYNRVESGDPSFLADTRDWDETPTEDPNDPDNLLPQGGEYADLDPFDETYQMLYESMPNPELTMNMNYGQLLVTYSLTSANMNAIGAGLFSAGFWTNLKNKFEGLSDPLSMITNVIQIPMNIAGSAQNFKLGGIEVEDGEGHAISCTRTNTRYVKFPMGAVTLKEVWGSDKDYSDTTVSVFLPYVGVKEVDPDIVIGSTMSLVCYVDIWTGDVVYLMHVSNASAAKKYFAAQSVPYRWTGNCAKKVPLGRVDNSNQILSMLGTLGGLAVGVGMMGAGLGGAVAAGGLANLGAADTAAMAAGFGTAKIGAGITGASAIKALHSNYKPTVQTSSGVQGASGQMDYQYAYVMVKRGVPKYPNNWRAQFGATNYQTFQGLSMTGFTQFSEIHLTGMADASEAERKELERLLIEEGVIL